MNRQEQFHHLGQSITQLEANTIGIGEFIALWRGSAGLREALPERYQIVLDDLLARLESTALFSEESCSFSRSDLLNSLRLWLDKAGKNLGLQDPASTGG